VPLDTASLVAGTYDTNLDRNGSPATLEITVNGSTITATGDGGSTGDLVGPSVAGGASFVFPIGAMLTPPAA
jgi:hypothetical protein